MKMLEDINKTQKKLVIFNKNLEEFVQNFKLIIVISELLHRVEDREVQMFNGRVKFENRI